MREYINIDQRLHLLCQIPAKVTANLITEKSDYSHTNLAFDPIGKRINSRWIDAKEGKILLSINLIENSLEWINEDLFTLKTFEIPGKTFFQLENEIQASLPDVGIVANDLKVELKYKMEQFTFKDTQYTLFEMDALSSWIYFRTLANFACDAALDFFNDQGEIRIWPHHFDTGIYIELGKKLGVGFGLAVKDSLVGTPYFYFSGYALTSNLAMEELPTLQLGEWKTGEWKGAVLSLNLLDNQNYNNAFNVVFNFIQETFNWYQKSLFK